MATHPPGRLNNGGPPRPPLPDVEPTPAPPAPGPVPVPPPSPLPNPPPSIAMIDVPAVSSRFTGDTLYAEILNRDPNPFTTSDRPTNAHESCHGINARIRNQAGGRNNGFYAFGGKGIVVPEPSFRLSAIRDYIPASVRGNRYQLYLVQQAGDWDDQPLYLCDEWVAYCAGLAVAVEDNKAGRLASADWLAGPVEFAIYALALAQTCNDKDPGAWSAGKIHSFLAWQLAVAGQHYEAGKDIAAMNFGQQFELLDKLRHDDACAKLRTVLATAFPAAVAWMLKSELPTRRGASPLGRIATCTHAH